MEENAMLLEFKFKNWLSFYGETEFTMMATRERDPFERLATDNAFTGRVLPLTAIYGYNASGKTNFIDAIFFLKRLVLTKNDKTNLQPFAFVNSKRQIPSYFYIKFLTNTNVYEYEIELDTDKILYEKLSSLGKTTKNVLFERKENVLTDLSKEYTNDEKTRLSFVMQGTASSQSFFNNTYSQQVKLFKEAYEWFSNGLVIIGPNTNFFEPNTNDDSYEDFNMLLKNLDISNSEYIRKPIDADSLNFVPQFLSTLNRQLKDGDSMCISQSVNVRKVNNKLEFSSVRIRHKNLDNHDSTTELELATESDGTKRLYELRPVLRDLLLKKSDVTFIVDELDRSLHPLLVRHLIELFNQCCNRDIRRQLIFTCHDSSLLDQELMRRDSYWIITKDFYGESKIQRITNLKQGKRTDKSIRNAYMSGELGVAPSFLKTN